MQPANHKTTTILRFLENALIAEITVLIAIAVLWRLTAWHTTANYGVALTTAGGIISGLGLINLAGGRSSNDVKLTEGEMEMRSWSHNDNRRFTSRYSELVQTSGGLIGIGILTMIIAVVIRVFFP